MSRYYTRACNFYYGSKSKSLVKNNKALPLNGNDKISFDTVEIVSRKSVKKIAIKNIENLSPQIRRIIKKDVKIITKIKKNFRNLSFKNTPIIMGVLNITPDSFSDGGKYFSKKTIKLSF